MSVSEEVREAPLGLAGAGAPPLLATRLAIPSPAPSLVARPRLTARLERAGGRVGLVVAPAGSGKVLPGQPVVPGARCPVPGARYPTDLKMPEGLSEATQAAIREAIREPFVGGFRLVAYLAAGLAAGSALAAWLLIAGKAQPCPMLESQG